MTCHAQFIFKTAPMKYLLIALIVVIVAALYYSIDSPTSLWGSKQVAEPAGSPAGGLRKTTSTAFARDRPASAAQQGKTNHYRARVGQHLSNGALVLWDRPDHPFVLFLHPHADEARLGDYLEFDARTIGTVQMNAMGGGHKFVDRMIYAGPR